MKLSPDFKTREVICTGIRFPVSIKFNRHGDLFATEQEGATWCPGGNVVDKLMHIIRSIRDSGIGILLIEHHMKLVMNVCDRIAVLNFGVKIAEGTPRAISSDPTALGLVANLQRPEANVTGAARITEPLNPERLKVLCELAPPTRPVAFLLNSNRVSADTTNERIREMEAVAHAAGHQLVVLDLAGRPDILAIFAGMAKQGVGAFVISTEALFNVWRDQVISLSANYGIAAMFPNREYVLAGGLISYGADFYEHYRVAGTYAGRILKGETPADLPVLLPTKTEMVINLRTAKALGLTVPQTLLRDATEVIE